MVGRAARSAGEHADILRCIADLMLLHRDALAEIPHALGDRFFEPSIATNVTPAIRITQEEIFGPLAPVSRFGREDAVIALANDTEFGLAVYLHARALGRAWRVAEALEVKSSGLGHEGSRYGIDDYLEQKKLCMAID